MSTLRRMFGREQRPAAPLPYPPGSAPELAARWLRWIASVPGGRSPLTDSSGSRAAVNQPADVWFLAGTQGGTATRRCTIPAGMPLFFPVINMWTVGGPPRSLPYAATWLAVDDVPAPVREIATPEPFEVPGAALNPVTQRLRPVPMTVWGWWHRLDPLPPGPHSVRFEGTDGGDFRLGVDYRLEVG